MLLKIQWQLSSWRWNGMQASEGEEKSMDTRPIGVFDSGVGGLTVVKQIMKVMPHENIVYFGCF